MTNKEVKHSVSSQWLTLADLKNQLREEASKTTCAKKRKQLESVVGHISLAGESLIDAMFVINYGN